MIYTRNDIELELNKVLAEKMADGFAVFTSRDTAGHQGEVFKLYLKKGKTIGVLYLDGERKYHGDKWWFDNYVLHLRWAVYPDDYPNRTFWLNDAKVVMDKCYYILGRGYYANDNTCFADEETAKAAAQKRHDRSVERQKNFKADPALNISDPAVRKKVVDIVRRNCKRAKWMTYKSLSVAKFRHDRAYGCDRFLLEAFEVMPNGDERCHTVVISEVAREV